VTWPPRVATLRLALAVDPSIRLGLELPPIHISAGAALAPQRDSRALWAVADAATRSGFEALWLHTASGSHDTSLVDGCTLAGALAPATSLALGVCSPTSSAATPSILARDVTTLDVITSGRAALRLSADGDATQADLERLSEAAGVCRALFTRDVSDVRGRFYRLAHAPNRPRAVRPGGPPLLVDLGVDSLASLGDGAPALARDLLSNIDAVVVTGPVTEFVAARVVLERTWRALEVEPVALIWRSEESGPGAPDVAALVGLGVNGVIVGLGDEELWGPDPGASVEGLARALTDAGRVR